jgi:hypothetical protein
MRHAALTIVYVQVEDQFELAKGAIASVLAQDIGPLDILYIDNGSTYPGLRPWLDDLAVFLADSPHKLTVIHSAPNKSPIIWANWAYGQLFKNYDKVLSFPDDVVLPENCYRLMSEWPRGLVTGSMTDQREFPRVEWAEATSECTPAAVSVLRKWFHEALVSKDGYFLDEGYVHYASDCDLALRMAACGLRGIQLNLPYYHYGSASWRLLEPREGRKLTLQADFDRAYFHAKWGFAVADDRYGQTSSDINFRAIPQVTKAAAAKTST